jgi:hypothetical protein
LLEQIAVNPATAGQRVRDLRDVVAAEDLRDGLLTVRLVDVVEAYAAVEQTAGGVVAGRRLDVAGVIGVLCIFLRPPTSTGTSSCTALSTSPSSTPSLPAMSLVGI